MRGEEREESDSAVRRGERGGRCWSVTACVLYGHYIKFRVEVTCGGLWSVLKEMRGRR